MRTSVCRLVLLMVLSLPTLPVSAVAAAPGDVVADFKATDVLGQPVSLADLVARRKVAVFFWDSRRAISTRAIRAVDRLQHLYRKKGLEVLAVEGEGSAVELVSERVEMLRAIGAAQRYTIVPDPGGIIARQLRVESTPQIFLLDGTGRVLFHLEGFGEDSELLLERRIREDMLAEKPPVSPPQASAQQVAAPQIIPAAAPDSPREPSPVEDPADTVVKKYRYFGNFHLNRGELEKAEDYFHKIVEVSPKDIPAWLRIGEVCARQRRYDKAREAWDQVLRIDPGNKDADVYIRQLIRGEY